MHLGKAGTQVVGNSSLYVETTQILSWDVELKEDRVPVMRDARMRRDQVTKASGDVGQRPR